MLWRMDVFRRQFAFMAILCLACIACVALTGCASGPIGRLELRAAEYDRVFDAAVASLRDQRFTLDRIDRRLGVITTRPRAAASVLEPWKGDNSTPAQAFESTLQYQRRLVRIEFTPLGGIEPATGVEAMSPFGQVSPAEPFFLPAEHPGTLVLSIRCIVERSHRPGLQVDTVAVRRSNVTTDPSLRERGVASQFWEPVARDAHMETRLKRRVMRHAGTAVNLVEPTLSAR